MTNTTAHQIAPRPEQLAARPLTGRTALVTGATSGIGEATARRLALAGADVAVVGRRAERLEALQTELATAAETHGDGIGRALPVAADITEAGALDRVAEQVRAGLGPVDLVVANAGVMLAAPFESADPAELHRMLDLNVKALVATGQAFAADLLAAGEAGRPTDLIHVGSVASHVVFPNYAVYGATKAAIVQLTKMLRVEWGSRGVRVHNVEPGFTKTELGDHMTYDGMADELDGMRNVMGVDNMLTADDLAATIAFAASLPARANLAEFVVVPTVKG